MTERVFTFWNCTVLGSNLGLGLPSSYLRQVTSPPCPRCLLPKGHCHGEAWMRSYLSMMLPKTFHFIYLWSHEHVSMPGVRV